MKHLATVLTLAIFGLALPAVSAHAAPTLQFTSVSGYQLSVAGNGWNPQSTVTFSLIKGDIVQSLRLRPEADGSFVVGISHANICGVLSYGAGDQAGTSATLHGPGVMCTNNSTFPPAGTATLTVVKGQTAYQAAPDLAPKPLVKQYFTDLNAHRYADAHQLEATCAVTVKLSTPHGATDLQLPGAVPYRPGDMSAKAFVRAAHVTSIRRFGSKILNRLHVIGFHVSGSFKFVYPAIGTHGVTGNNELKSGRHRLAIIVRQCNGHWALDPNWTETGGLPWK